VRRWPGLGASGGGSGGGGATALGAGLGGAVRSKHLLNLPLHLKNLAFPAFSMSSRAPTPPRAFDQLHEPNLDLFTLVVISGQ
jgi:hypothetical protein